MSWGQALLLSVAITLAATNVVFAIVRVAEAVETCADARSAP